MFRTRVSLLVAGVLLLHAVPARANSSPLRQYAQTTWASMAAMTDPASGLPADILNADGTTSVQTSTTNIGAYMWSAVAAQRLGIIDRGELVTRLGRTLTELPGIARCQGP